MRTATEKWLFGVYIYIYIYLYGHIHEYICWLMYVSIYIYIYIIDIYNIDIIDIYIHIYIYIYIYIKRLEQSKMRYICRYIFVYICLTISSSYYSIHLALGLIGRDGSFSTLCHSCGFACQQRVLKTFPGPDYLHSEDAVVWLWHSLVNLYIYIYIYIYIIYILNIYHIYIYIYIKRERERERLNNINIKSLEIIDIYILKYIWLLHQCRM